MRQLRLTVALAVALAGVGSAAAVHPASAVTVRSPSGSALQHTLQDVLDDARVRTRSPGASAAVMMDGRILWAGSSGLADAEMRQPVIPSTLYSLASVTKMFVSTIVLRLFEEGKLRLDDPIALYVPQYMPSTREVRIRNLLGHTSGYRDVEGDPIILRWLADPNHIWRREEILRRVTPVDFEPGSRFRYSNTNYVILGEIVKSASNSEIGEEFERLIVDRVGLRGEAIFERLPGPADRIAHGYNYARDTFDGAHLLGVPTAIWGTMWTDGGLAATATGVARFTDALFGGRILRPQTLAIMIDPGPNHSYGLGTYHMRFDGREWQGHDGYYYGFTTVTMYDFSRRVTITVLTNHTDNGDPAYAIWDRLAAAYDRLR